MYHAAICEDERDIASYIEKTLASEFAKHNIQVEFDIFYNGNKLLEMIDEHYHFDLVFMDIEMPEIDGISICRKIRQTNEDSLVVFISNKDELVFSTFEVQPFRFVRKSHYDSLLPELVNALDTELARRNPSNIQIVEPRSKDIFSFDVNKIQYVEAQGKNCLIHSVGNITEIKISLSEIEELLKDYEFIKPHRSYLVNYKFITSIKKNNLELTTSELIPISRNRVEDVKHEFIMFTNRSL
ncbi:MAG: response regulator transcription factor [Pseudobutyrivibrio sp.]|nr:response regulator transcription factor [Pseudobutyrivibrio sp.]